MADKKPILSRPKDESLEAFKAWIMEIFTRFTGKTESEMSEEKWKEKYQAFWAKEKADEK
jgi:hypothetical protein